MEKVKSIDQTGIGHLSMLRGLKGQSFISDQISRNRLMLCFMAMLTAGPTAAYAGQALENFFDRTDGDKAIGSILSEGDNSLIKDPEPRVDLDKVVDDLMHDPDIQPEIQQIKSLFSGVGADAVSQPEILSIFASLNDKLAEKALTAEVRQQVEAELAKQDPAIQDEVVENLGLKLSPEQKREFFFYLTSILMGLGIAFDVVASTISRFRHFNKSSDSTKWWTAVGATHISFPIIGGSLAAGASLLGETVNRGVAAVGFLLIAHLLYGELFGDEKDEENDEKIEKLDARKFWINTLAVSMDALTGGPAKFEESALLGWSNQEILGSITIGGGVVALCAFLAATIARKMNQSYQENKTIGEIDSGNMSARVDRVDKVCLAGESTVLGYFAYNSLLNGAFDLDMSRVWIMALSAATTAVAMYLRNNRQQQKECADS